MNEPMNRLSFDHDVHGGFSNRPARGRLPYPLPNPLRLNLGCGHDVREHFVNIDLYSDDPRVVGMDVRNLQLPDACADLVLASDVLEHFSHRETAMVLAEWARVLKPGGELVIRCPSLRLQIKAYSSGVWDADIASYMIFGGQTNPGDYHCIGFDERSIHRHLEGAGFTVTSFEEVDTPQDKGFINLNMTVRAKRVGNYGSEMTSISASAAVKEVSDGNSLANRSATGGSPQQQEQSGPFVNIVWEGSQFVWHSLALVNRELCSRIVRTNVAELTIVPYEPDVFSPAGTKMYEKLAAQDIRFKQKPPASVSALPYIWVRHQWPPKTEPPHGAKWVIMQPWEFSALRKDFVELFNSADEVWTPSAFCRRVFVESGVEFDKVQIVPNGVNPNLFTPNGKAQSLPGEKALTFLYVGGTIFRKGIDILLEAYVKTFTASDNVRLVVKDMGGDSFYHGQTAKDFIEKLKAAPGAPQINYTDAYLSEEEMAELYRSCDVLVSPYRGEGFSLPALEALACGLPIIVTEGGATDDFADESVGWLIPAGRRSIGNAISGHELTAEGFLLEPDGEALSEILRYCYNNPAECKAKGLAGSLRARTQWTWNRAALKMFSRLDYLSDTAMASKAEKDLLDKDDSAIAFARAEQEFAAGNTDEAVALCHAALMMGGLPPQYSARLLNRLALISLDDRDSVLCEEFLDKTAALAPHNTDARYIRALCRLSNGDYVAALEILNPLLEEWKTARLDSALGFRLDVLLATTGDALYGLDAPDEALTLYEHALKINSENAPACFGAALCLRDLDAPADARTMFDWAVRLDPAYAAFEQDFISEQ